MTPRRGSLIYREDAGPISEIILTSLAEFFRFVLSHDSRGVAFPGRRPIAADAERLSRTIVNRILSSAPIRRTPVLSARNLSVIEARINHAIRRGLPISAHILWSPKKHWMRGPDSSVDLAELAALQTLLSVHCAVRDVSGLQIVFHVCVEDIEFEFMEGSSDELIEASHRYVSGLRRLVDVLGLSDVFSVLTTSERAAGGAQLTAWRTQIAENHRALKAYWYESETCMPDQWGSLPSFHDLRRIGWRGTLSPEMRRYYLNRLRPPVDTPHQERVDMVLRNLAGVLLHHQTSLLGETDGVEPIRFSFVPPAEDAPEQLLLGRVDLRFVPRKVCSLIRAAAPWSTKGYLITRDGRVHLRFRGWRDIANAKSRFREVRWSLMGAGGTADIRADLLCDPVR